MKIGIDLRMYSSQFTGIGRYCYELVENLIEFDRKNSYVFFLNDPQYDEFVEGMKELLENGRDGQTFKAVRVNAKHFTVAEQLKFLVALNKEKLDLMHFTSFNAPVLYRKPCVVTIHDLTPSFFPGKKMTKFYHRMGYHLVLKNILRKAKKIIAVSKHTELDIHRLYNFTRKKTVMIYEAAGDEFKAMDMNVVGEVMKKHGIDKEYVLYTGVHRDHKNVVGLIGAFAKLRMNFGFDGYLIITGRPDPFYPEVQEAVTKLKLEGVAKLVGLVPEQDLIALYNGATVYAYPSFYEGFGLPALEAFACETPVVASNKSCIPEVCEDAAIYFDPKNLDEMSKKLNEVLSDETLRERLITKGLERLKKFSWKKMAEKTLGVYDSIT